MPDDEWRDRANAAEDELSALRKRLRRYAAHLRDPEYGGPVGYRGSIAADIEGLLALRASEL